MNESLYLFELLQQWVDDEVGYQMDKYLDVVDEYAVIVEELQVLKSTLVVLVEFVFDELTAED